MRTDSVTVTIEHFAPRSVDEAVAAFARRVVEEAAPASPSRAKALLFAASRLGAFAVERGLALDEQVLLGDASIERCCSSGAFRLATARTIRANLRFLRRHVCRPAAPRPALLPRDRAKPPYSASELACYFALCDAQPTALRRQRLSALLCLGAGAGLIGGELRGVAGNDVCRRFGGVTVAVKGRRPRTVPVLPGFHDRLCEVASFFGAERLLCPDPHRHNVTGPLLRSLSGGIDLERLSANRLRSTYLCALAETIGLRAFMDAAGISCSQRLGDLVGELPPRSLEEAVALLGRAR